MAKQSASSKAGKYLSLCADLKATATTINSAMRAVELALGKVIDKRLEAAVGISEAKETCASRKISFKKWADEKLAISYETARKLAPIGDAERAEEGKGKAMLEDVREQNKLANQRLRERQKANGSFEPEDGGDDGGSDDTDPVKKFENRKKSILNVFNAMSEEEKRQIVAELASELNIALATPAASKPRARRTRRNLRNAA